MKKTISTYDEKARLRYKIRNVITPCLNGFETFLKDVKNKIPDLFPKIIDNLNTIYEKIEKYNVSIESDYEILNQYPKILDGSLNQVLSLVNYNKYSPDSIDEEIDIEAFDLICTFTHFEYFFMSSLLKVMPREEAIEYVKNMADKIAQSRREPDRYVNSFEELIERDKPNFERWQSQDLVYDIIDDGKMLYKVTKCRWGEVMKEFDLEFCYALNCYSDFETTKNQNPNFVITRTKTILMGDEYCDFCYHDSRKDKDLIHPSEKDFQELG
ncbi:MAG: L-2-amino-thiazoline-4-carboxylic acid hydrolase [Candidatus Lokiarchaeota archaeon]|nr:L-2-amino-thiazoline-4-carboxylic acid hydrolase [Candidatus Lokiarchaeota archaeon]